VLFKAGGIVGNADEAIFLYLRHSSSRTGPVARELYSQIALLYELTSRYSAAAEYYNRAAGSVEPSDPGLTLRYLQLRYQMGDIPEDRELDALLMRDLSHQVYVDALMLKAEVLFYREDWGRAEKILVQSRFSNLYPEIQLALWELYKRTGNEAEKNRVFDFVRSTYPDLVERAIMEGRIEKKVRLSDFFLSQVIRDNQSEIPPPEVEQPLIVVQTGVFSKRDNAELMVQNLRSLGFSARIAERDSLYKVLVEGKSPNTLQDLKIRGFEGFVTNSR